MPSWQNVEQYVFYPLTRFHCVLLFFLKCYFVFCLCTQTLCFFENGEINVNRSNGTSTLLYTKNTHSYVDMVKDTPYSFTDFE